MNFLLLLVITVLIPWLHPSPCFYKRRRQWAHWHKFMRTRKMIQRSMAKDWAKQKYECLLPNWYFKTLLIHRISNCTTVNQTLLIHRISNCTTANHQTIGPNSFFPVREITEIGSSLSLSLSLSQTWTRKFIMPKESKGKEIRLEYHFEATLTIRRTLPLYSLRLTSFPRISCHQIQLITKKKKKKKKANSKQLFS